MWKHLAGYFAAAFLGSALGMVGAATIPFFNPQQLQIPATGADLNNLVRSINSSVVLTNGTSFNVAPNTPSSVAPGGSGFTSTTSNGQIANGITVSGALSGGWPSITASGTDANVGLVIGTQGRGQLLFSNPNNIVTTNGFGQCPGASVAVYRPIGMAGYVNKFLLVEGVFGPGTQAWVPLCQ